LNFTFTTSINEGTMKAMRIGFDISQLAHFGGVNTYTQNLATGLQNNQDLDVVFFYSSLRKPYRGNLKDVKRFNLPPTFFELFFNKLHNVPIERFIGPIDIFHSSDWVQPPTKAKKVTTYHDLVPLKYPKWSHPKIVEVNKRRLALVEKEIDLVIAVSQSTKKDLLEVSKIPEEKIVVIYEGVEKRFQPQTEEAIKRFKREHELPERFILAIGGIGERRNLNTVKKATEGFNLIVTRENINIPFEQMPLLYASSQLLLYPSFYEGFGLPILEAMACGVPVITSNVSSMPEVAGDAAQLVDPNDLSQIKKVVNKIMTEEKFKQQLIRKGLANAKKFSWDKTVNETVKAYQSLLLDEK
jgi:glycosyltransferase involved in cell wall biosynthesis